MLHLQELCITKQRKKKKFEKKCQMSAVLVFKSFKEALEDMRQRQSHSDPDVALVSS